MDPVVAFYDEHPINELQIRSALERAGKDPDALSPTDLYDFDQDHYGGLDAVAALADGAGVAARSRVLDVCSGMGGPARFLAERYGAEVVGIDLNDSRVRGATRLSAMVGLQDRVRFARGDATALPLPGTSFDAVIAQEAFLHIANKSALFAECHRVLRPGGKLAFTDWLAGPALGDSDRTRLADGIAAIAIHDAGSYRRFIEAAGFRDVAMQDLSPMWRRILRERLEMYRSMREDTVAQFGPERHAAYVDAYIFFVEAIETGRLGGARWTARR